MTRAWAGIGAIVVLAALPVAWARPHPPDPAAYAGVTVSHQPPHAPSAPAPSDPATAPAEQSATIALSGDVLIHDTVWQAAHRDAVAAHEHAWFEFRPMLAPIRSVIAGADYAICHLETPVAEPGGPYASYPVFAVPSAIVPALAWTGYDACSTASNHSVDQGYDGVVRTLDALDSAGLAHTGTYRSPAETRSPTILDVKGVRVGWLSYTFGTNGIPVEKPWSVNLIDPDRILADARAAREAGAEAVLVALHWGDEYSHEPSDYQLDVARRLTASPDITLVYGHHAHVTQASHRVNGTWVVYGLGNLIADQHDVAPGTMDGRIVTVTLTRSSTGVAVTGLESTPTHIDVLPGGDFRVRPAG